MENALSNFNFESVMFEIQKKMQTIQFSLYKYLLWQGK